MKESMKADLIDAEIEPVPAPKDAWVNMTKLRIRKLELPKHKDRIRKGKNRSPSYTSKYRKMQGMRTIGSLDYFGQTTVNFTGVAR